MKRSEFRALINECILDAFENNSQVKQLVLEAVTPILVEAVKQQSALLAESKQPDVPKEPTNPELYDKLMMVAQGQTKGFKYEGRAVNTPNYGNGYKSGKAIKEWTEKVYSRVGGEWESVSKSPNKGNISALHDMMGGLEGFEGGGGGVFTNAGDDTMLREELQRAGLGGTRSSLSSEEGQEGSQRIDITDILMDTAKTTLLEQDARSGIGPVSDGASMVVATSTPEELFGEEATSQWADMAFD